MGVYGDCIGEQIATGGDTLVVVAIDRIGRRWPDTIRSICELRDREVKIRSLAEAEADGPVTWKPTRAAPRPSSARS